MLPRSLVFVAFALSMLAVGCRKSGEERLTGLWRGNHVEGVTPEQEPAARAFAIETELHFRDGAIMVKTPKSTSMCAFKVAQTEKNMVTVITDLDGPSNPQTFDFADDETMHWLVVPGKRITFHRVSQ
ncbi:hypothetical protein [Pendulispora albinea]|uniref:Lipocalin-like domain-containing protein n=1 Tax=Pendulispora albinea TaxID=2741071 RepID=A0ABZ2LXJ0_9BACT